MSTTKPEKWYAVRVGRNPGIYRTWLEASGQVIGFEGAKYKGFTSQHEAEQFMNQTGTRRSIEPSRTFAPQIPTTVEPINRYVIYTDGSYNQRTMGFAIYDPQQQEVVYGPVLPYEGKISNNVAEFMAIWYAIALFREISTPLTKVMLTDSEYAMKTLLTYIPGWIRKYGESPSLWKTSNGRLPENLNLIDSVYQALPPDVKIEHVRAHVGIEGNELVDRYADLGRSQKEVTRIKIR
jgi:ribonuclease HI